MYVQSNRPQHFKAPPNISTRFGGKQFCFPYIYKVNTSTTTLHSFYATHNIPCLGIPGECSIICWDCPLPCAVALVRGIITSCLPLPKTPAHTWIRCKRAISGKNKRNAFIWTCTHTQTHLIPASSACLSLKQTFLGCLVQKQLWHRQS